MVDESESAREYVVEVDRRLIKMGSTSCYWRDLDPGYRLSYATNIYKFVIVLTQEVQLDQNFQIGRESRM